MRKLVIASVGLVALGSFLISCQDQDAFSRSKRRHWPPDPTPPVVTPPPVVPPVTPPSASPLDKLPKDVGGQHKPIALGATTSPYGFYLYTPSGYTATGPRFPLLIFMHGSGEVGNSSTDLKALDKVLVNGPPKLIKNGTWAPKYPMVVASVQCHEGWWDFEKVKKFTEFIMANYQVDTTRMYMTGLSMGGYGTWDQLTVYGKGSHITAAVPVSGGGVVSDKRVKNASALPIWAFHGEVDQNVLPDYDIAVHTAINALNPPIHAKLTMYPGTGHDAWTKTYNGTGMGTEDKAYDPFNMDVYTWLLQYSKN